MTREELRDYVEEQRNLGIIPYYVYSTLIDGIDTLEQQPCEDAISRQAVLDAMRKNHRSGGRDIDGDYIEGDYRECLYDDIISLPPVNPQYTEDEIQKMQDLEQAELEKAYELGKAEGQKNEDVISRQAVLGKAIDYGSNTYLIPVNSVKALPPVTPKTGHWIIEVWNNKEHHTCSNCQHVVTYEPCYHYCPYCGAKMIEPQESEEE